MQNKSHRGFRRPLIATGFALASLGFGISACGSDEGDATTSSDLAASTAVVGDALAMGTAGFFTSEDSAERAACTATAWSACADGVSERALPETGCSRGASARSVTVYGKVTLTKSPATCPQTLATDESLTRTYSGFYIGNHGGKKVITYTSAETVDGRVLGEEDLKDFEGTARSGGSKITKTASGYSLEITGVHRRAFNRKGKGKFWHTIYTSAPIVVTESSTEFTIDSGTIVLANNRKEEKVTVDLAGLKYAKDGSCAYPTGGTATHSFSASPNSTLKATFSASACGTVSLDEGAEQQLPEAGASDGE